MTSQSTMTLRGPRALRSIAARSARPTRRWISNVRPPGVRGEAFVRVAERGLRVKPRITRRGHDVEEELAEEFLIIDVEREIEARRLELHARGPLEHALGREERGKLARDATQQATSV